MDPEFTESLAQFAQSQVNTNDNFSSEINLRPTSKGDKFDIYKVDYNWINTQTNKRELRLAFDSIKTDGGFPDLLKCIRDRLRVVDPKFKTTEDFNTGISTEYAKEVNSDVLAFLKQAKENDEKLRDGVAPLNSTGTKNMEKSIFGESKLAQHEPKPTQQALDFAAQIEKKRQAEEQRFMGNESMKSKDYDDAISHYTKSLEMFPDEAATYSNRAMAFLSKKMYKKAIEDSNKCLEI